MFSHCQDQDFDATLTAYTGPSADQLTNAGTDEFICNAGGSWIWLLGLAGHTYSIVVDGTNGESGNFNLRWELLYEGCGGPCPPVAAGR